ncbi:MAG: glycosyltransferase family 4 protein [Patescibacteria group bacterium]
MRIAVFIKSTTFNKGYGGLETQNKVLCEGLANRGHEIVMFSPAMVDKTATTMDSAGSATTVKYVFVPCVYHMLLASIDKNNWFNKSYQEFLKFHQEKPFDAVISQSSAGLGVIKRKRKLGINIVGISHGTIGSEMKTLLNSAKNTGDVVKSAKSLAFGMVNYFGRQRQYINGCNKIVAVSSAVKESIINETFAPEKKITVIHNGIDGSKIPPKNWDDDKDGEPFKVLYIGRIEESKGLRELLLACKDIDGIFVNIIGDGPFLEELKSLSRQYRMSQKVLFYGKLPYEKAVEMYSCNDVFVLPTKRVEGFPMTLVEACFAGLPIIATDMGGNKDAVANKSNGFLLAKLDIDTLKSKILELVQNRELAKSMGLDGRIKAEKEFTLDKMIDSYEKIL